MVLEAMYRGAIHPQEMYHPIAEAHKRKRKELMAAQRDLIEKMDEECRDKLENLLEELDMVETVQMEETYIQGMRMGARLMMELLEKEDLPENST